MKKYEQPKEMKLWLSEKVNKENVLEFKHIVASCLSNIKSEDMGDSIGIYSRNVILAFNETDIERLSINNKKKTKSFSLDDIKKAHSYGAMYESTLSDEYSEEVLLKNIMKTIL